MWHTRSQSCVWMWLTWSDTAPTWIGITVGTQNMPIHKYGTLDNKPGTKRGSQDPPTHQPVGHREPTNSQIWHTGSQSCVWTWLTGSANAPTWIGTSVAHPEPAKSHMITIMGIKLTHIVSCHILWLKMCHKRSANAPTWIGTSVGHQEPANSQMCSIKIMGITPTVDWQKLWLKICHTGSAMAPTWDERFGMVR